jgi:hypothetical protein
MERLKKHFPTLNIVEIFKIPPEYHDGWDDKGDFYGVFTQQKVMFVFFVEKYEAYGIWELVPFFWPPPLKKWLDKKAAEFILVHNAHSASPTT